MSAVLATHDDDARIAAERAVVLAHQKHERARYLVAHTQAKALFAQAAECRAVADLETVKGYPAHATTLRHYATGCEQRGREEEARAQILLTCCDGVAATELELDA